MQPHHNNSPVNPLPPVVAALAVVIVAIELIFFAGSKGVVGGPSAIGWRLAAMQQYAFSPDIAAWMWDSGVYPAEHLLRFISYLFLHGNFTHALFGAVIILALGKMVGEVMHPVAVVVIFLLSGVVGAFAYSLAWADPAPLIGSYPGAYGFIGAFTFLMWAKLRSVGENQSRAFTLIAFLLGIQLVFGVLFGGSGDWVADLAGFCTGFALSFVLVPGGWARIRARIRHD
ncbi:rhomboid family intramembrane serine protease [Cognatishimia sp. SS12]|uniref:rhomboid family intramembrane serine protease n=1 Tax=Cognatishimia sp. SS12 TaxID=2979465 RepID=UPI00232B1BF2|nr:rhomboid family intramembrane serine protease [Cognatishimia sp. SS12]MDC0739020.1 rhomboid family intramembrane serine protease [Cognatishimia sp. SS12]